MSFPSTSTTTLARVFDLMLEHAAGIKRETQVIRQQATTDTTTVARILMYVARLRASRAQLVALAQTPGLEAYATVQLGQTANIAASYNAMVGAVDSTIAWVVANLPKDVNGYLQAVQIGAGGVVVERAFQAVVLADFRAQLDALATTIE